MTLLCANGCGTLSGGTYCTTAAAGSFGGRLAAPASDQTPGTPSIHVFAGVSAAALTPPLSPGEVHVWHFNRQTVAGELEWLKSLLSSDEQQRARRFHYANDRDLFVTARGLLRSVAAGYLGVAPGAVQFRYSAKGKPELDGRHPASELYFNVSHSGDLVVLAFAHKRRVGVDVEQIQADALLATVAQRFFSPAEVALLRSLPAPERLQMFYRCWTRKEAYLKAIGAGLADALEVSVNADRAYGFIQRLAVEGRVECWRLQSLDLQAGYAAALATECAVPEHTELLHEHHDGFWNGNFFND